MIYHYWTIRWVPDVVRGEYVNIGVLVGNGERDWAFRAVENLQRATALGGDAGRATSFLSALRRRVESTLLPDSEAWGGRPLSFADVERMRAHQSNAVQLAAPRVLSVTSAEQGLQIMYPLMVEEPERRTRDTSRRQLVRALDKDLQAAIGPQITTRHGARARAEGQRGNFDLVFEHEEHLQLAHAWSFTVRDQDRLAQTHQAWAWFVRMLRKDGGMLQPGGGDSRYIDKDTPLAIVHDRPQTAEQREVFDSARTSWRDLGVAAFEKDEMSDAVTQITRDLALAS